MHDSAAGNKAGRTNKMNWIIALLIIGGVAGACVFIAIWQKKKAKAKAIGEPLSNFTSVDIDWTLQNTDGSPGSPTSVNNFTGKTPAGTQYLSYCDVPLIAQLCIDQGIAQTIADSPWKMANYGKPEEFWVIIKPPDLHSVNNDPGAPLINVRTNVGTVSSPSIRVTPSAGTVIGPGVKGVSWWTNDILGGIAMPKLTIVVAADPDFGHLRFLRNAVRNEAEHVVECGNDAATALPYLTVNDVHPHRGRDIWFDPLPYGAIDANDPKP